MTKDRIQYDAFISYRHSELDSFVAETLHKRLESFKLPRNVARRKQTQAADAAAGTVLPDNSDTSVLDRAGYVTKPVKTKINRVFRDKEELPLVTNLADPITEALRNSEYLIVICSPRLPESMWCRKEIETFIEMHDREHVLAVLVEGEPDISFPEELLYREVEEHRPDGSVVKKRIPVEPLAADVRGADRKEIRKKIGSELLRLAAPMFDCNYDDLKQRHKEQRLHKILMTSVSISAACLLFGVVSTGMALQIKHQNIQIKEQNTQITAQSEEITAQAREIAEQYREAKRNTAVSRAKEAAGYLEEGDRMRAVATAQDALLDLSESGGIEENVDYPAEAVYALSDSLYLYENGQQILPDRILEADTAVRMMKLSPEGSRILTMDASGQAQVWNPDNATDVVKIEVTCSAERGENQLAFLGEDCLFGPVEDEVILYNLSGGSAVPAYRRPCDDYVGIIVFQEKRAAILLSEKDYQAVDCNDGSLLYTGDWDLEGMAARSTLEYAVSADGRYWAVSLSTPYSEDVQKQAVAVYRVDTGERVNVFSVEYEYVKSLRFDEDRLYVVSNHSGEKDFTQVTLGMESCLQAFELAGNGEPAWTYERHNGWLYETSVSSLEGSSYVLCSGYSDVVALDKRDGSYIDLFGFGVEVVKLGNYTGTDNFMAFTRDGVWHYLHMERKEDMVGALFPACTSSNVMDFAIGDGYCVTLPYNSRRMTVYRTARGEGLETFYEGEYDYFDSALSGDGTCLAAAFYNDSYTAAVDLFDAVTGERRWCYENDSRYEGMLFFDYNGQEALVLITSDEIIVLDPGTGDRLRSEPLGLERSFDYLGCDREQENIILWDRNAIYKYDLTKMTACEWRYAEDTRFQDVVAVDPGLEYCAVADKEGRTLRFFRIGETEAFFTYNGEGGKTSNAAAGSSSGSQIEDRGQTDLNFPYIETMFFDREGVETESTGHLYIVYMDGRIVRLDLDPEDPEHFCRADSHRQNPEKYNGLDDIMRGYIHQEGDRCAIIRGNTDAYLMTGQKGDLLAHLHGFLGYDSVAEQIYLTGIHTIYRIPLYDLSDINGIAEETRNAFTSSSLDLTAASCP